MVANLWLEEHHNTHTSFPPWQKGHEKQIHSTQQLSSLYLCLTCSVGLFTFLLLCCSSNHNCAKCQVALAVPTKLKPNQLACCCWTYIQRMHKNCAPHFLPLLIFWIPHQEDFLSFPSSSSLLTHTAITVSAILAQLSHVDEKIGKWKQERRPPAPAASSFGRMTKRTYFQQQMFTHHTSIYQQ